MNQVIANVDLFDHGADPFSPVQLATPQQLPQPRIDGGTWTLQVPGEPVAKGRPKLGVVAGHAHAFTPKRTRTYEQIVREHAIREWNKRPMLAGRPIWMRATFVRAIPASWSIKKKNAASAGTIFPISRPDLSNYMKSIEDGLQGVVYADDSCIVESSERKVWGHIPHVVVTLTW